MIGKICELAVVPELSGSEILRRKPLNGSDFLLIDVDS
jgi:hypothetical protein